VSTPPTEEPDENAEVLKEIQTELYKRLRDKLRDGSATAQDCATARQVLRDNGMIVPPEPKRPPKAGDRGRTPLPDYGDPSDEE
jgi:hypothetical protein